MNAGTRSFLADATIIYILTFFLGALLAWVRVSPIPTPPPAAPLPAAIEPLASRNALQLNAAQVVIALVRQGLSAADERLANDPRVLKASQLLSEAMAVALRAKTSLTLNDQDASETLIQQAFDLAESADALIRSADESPVK